MIDLLFYHCSLRIPDLNSIDFIAFKDDCFILDNLNVFKASKVKEIKFSVYLCIHFVKSS